MKKISYTFGFIGLIASNVWAEKVDLDFAVTAISDNVYSIVSTSYGRPTPENKGWNSNSHFVVTDNGVLVFDTGSSEIIGQGIINAIKSVTDKPVRWVVNSHSHADHWLGNGAFLGVNTEIISTKSAIDIMNKHGKEDVAAFYKMTKGATGTTRVTIPSVAITEHNKRNFGGVDVEFIVSNDAHSPGDLLMWLPAQKIIFGGDVLSSDWMPIMTYHGDVANLIDTFYKVEKLKPIAILPGHGKPTTMASLRRDSDLLSAVSTLVKKAREDGRSFDDTLSQVITQLAGKYRPLYKDFDSNIKYFVTMVHKAELK